MDNAELEIKFEQLKRQIQLKAGGKVFEDKDKMGNRNFSQFIESEFQTFGRSQEPRQPGQPFPSKDVDE